MTWAKIDDGLHSDPWWLALSGDAAKSWVSFLSYSSAHLTDGYINEAAARAFSTPKAIAELEAEGKMLRNGAGWFLHDYLDYNPSKAQVLAERAARAERAKKGADARWKHARKDA